MVSVQEVPKRADRNPNTTFYLWTIKHDQVRAGVMMPPPCIFSGHCSLSLSPPVHFPSPSIVPYEVRSRKYPHKSMTMTCAGLVPVAPCVGCRDTATRRCGSIEPRCVPFRVRGPLLFNNSAIELTGSGNGEFGMARLVFSAQIRGYEVCTGL